MEPVTMMSWQTNSIVASARVSHGIQAMETRTSFFKFKIGSEATM